MFKTEGNGHGGTPRTHHAASSGALAPSGPENERGAAAACRLLALAWSFCDHASGKPARTVLSEGLRVLDRLRVEWTGETVGAVAVRLRGRLAAEAAAEWQCRSVGSGFLDSVTEAEAGPETLVRYFDPDKGIYLVRAAGQDRFELFRQADFERLAARLAAEGQALTTVDLRTEPEPTLCVVRRLAGKLHGDTAARPAFLVLAPGRRGVRLCRHGRSVSDEDCLTGAATPDEATRHV